MRLRKTHEADGSSRPGPEHGGVGSCGATGLGWLQHLMMSEVEGNVEVMQVDDDGRARRDHHRWAALWSTNDFSDGTDSDDIIITGDNTNVNTEPTENLNAEEENTSEAEKSGENTSEVDKSGEDTSEVETSAAETEEQAEEPGSLELLAPEDEEKKDEEKKD